MSFMLVKVYECQGCGLVLDASVSNLSRGAVLPRFGLTLVEISNASASRLNVLVLASVSTMKALVSASIASASVS